ncbi:MAG TPA: MnmC family methyltransferase [Polyangiaceae bacterium]|nr:MnmC family methyltransferase [Polyangiaceae bacterium]
MSERPPFEVVETRSGVRAMLDRRTGEVMHPLSGPVEEARTLYVLPSRLEERLREKEEEGPLVLLDVGLGAGSNAAAAWALSEARVGACTRRLHVVSFDRTLAALELALAPAHAASFGLAGATLTACSRLIEHGRVEGACTAWRASLGELPATLLAEPPASADLVYWDPFSPRASPELWTVGAFTALRRLCRDGATLHTYSGATATRTSLLLAGFAVGFGEVLPGGRQATIAATRPEEVRSPLDRRWLDRLSRSSAPFSSDAPGDAFDRIARLPQFR